MVHESAYKTKNNLIPGKLYKIRKTEGWVNSLHLYSMDGRKFIEDVPWDSFVLYLGETIIEMDVRQVILYKNIQGTLSIYQVDSLWWELYNDK